MLQREIDRRRSRKKLATFFLDEGPLRRELYPKHLRFFEAGLTHRIRLILAANRVGKTLGMGGYETTLHLTGRYPAWWKGRRFSKPVRAWAAGDTLQTTRDTVQEKLLGPIDMLGTGLIPANKIVGQPKRKSGSVPDAVESVLVRHQSGGLSTLTFKSYDQKRRAFQGTERELIWLDEEPPLDIYTECLTRTMTVDGIVMLTFTPLMGMSEVVMQFLPDGQFPGEDGTSISSSKFAIMASWDDVPHLTEEAKQSLLEEFPAYQRDARSKGIPMLGSGAIYQYTEDDYVVDPFVIPAWWPRAFALDVGWKMTAACWGAWDRENDVMYVYVEYRRGMAEPEVHAKGIKSKGAWIQGAIDPAARGRSQSDGQSLMQQYTELGLDLLMAENGVESGIFAVSNRLSTGRLKIFRSCTGLLGEMRIYRRDENGKIVKENDHSVDTLRYLVATADKVFTEMPSAEAANSAGLVGITDYDPYGEEAR